MQIRTVPPDTSGTFAGPLAAVSAVHAGTLQHCAALRQLLVPDAPDRQTCRDIALHFDAVAPRVHADEEAFLFPTLLESMAGSDAVCLREMTAGLTLQHRALAGLWGALRVPLTALAAGQPARLDVTAVEAFIAAQQHCIGIETLELLPMAARLFTDSELAWLHQMVNTAHTWHLPAPCSPPEFRCASHATTGTGAGDAVLQPFSSAFRTVGHAC